MSSILRQRGGPGTEKNSQRPPMSRHVLHFVSTRHQAGINHVSVAAGRPDPSRPSSTMCQAGIAGGTNTLRPGPKTGATTRHTVRQDTHSRVSKPQRRRAPTDKVRHSRAGNACCLDADGLHRQWRRYRGHWQSSPGHSPGCPCKPCTPGNNASIDQDSCVLDWTKQRRGLPLPRVQGHLQRRKSSDYRAADHDVREAT